MGHTNYSALETAALEGMDELANDPDMRLDMMLERGYMLFDEPSLGLAPTSSSARSRSSKAYRRRARPC